MKTEVSVFVSYNLSNRSHFFCPCRYDAVILYRVRCQFHPTLFTCLEKCFQRVLRKIQENKKYLMPGFLLCHFKLYF